MTADIRRGRDKKVILLGERCYAEAGVECTRTIIRVTFYAKSSLRSMDFKLT